MLSPDPSATDLVNSDLQREKQYDHGTLAKIIHIDIMHNDSQICTRSIAQNYARFERQR